MVAFRGAGVGVQRGDALALEPDVLVAEFGPDQPVHAGRAFGMAALLFGVPGFAFGGCALFAAHTNADSARPGVSDKLAELVGITPGRPIKPVRLGGTDKWGVHVPPKDAEKLETTLRGQVAALDETENAALDLDLGQVGLVQDLGQLANQGGVDFGVFLVIGHWSCALSFVVFDKRDGAQPRSRTWVRAAWTANS